MSYEFDVARYSEVLKRNTITADSGKISEVQGLVLKAFLPGATVGSRVRVTSVNGARSIETEVVGVSGRSVVLMPFEDVQGIGLGARCELIKQVSTVYVGRRLKGRVINALGEPIDNKGRLGGLKEMPLYTSSINPLHREPIDTPLDLGVRALNGCLTVGQGQRVGILAGSGVGKSVLLGMMARSTTADVNVIAMVGERGREVKEFLQNELGEEGLAKSVVICATGDVSALLRVRAAFLAARVAEYFASLGMQVLLTMDSITRFAMAQREIGLSAGEPPATKGYTPSVFQNLPKLLERAGRFASGGSVTGLYTVLVEGDDLDDPIADSVRSIVDGHVVLSRKLAESGHFPAIDILKSASRTMNACVSESHRQAALYCRQLLAIYRDSEDLINIGAYQKGSNPRIDQAVDFYPSLVQYLQQGANERASYDESVQELHDIFALERSET